MKEYDATEVAFKNGYKKAVTEIFGEIDKMLSNQEVVTEDQRCKEIGEWILHDYIPKRLAKIKKKYTEGEK